MLPTLTPKDLLSTTPDLSFDDWPSQLPFIRNHEFGCYAFFDGDKLVYVGLSTAKDRSDKVTGLRGRLRDHAGKFGLLKLVLWYLPPCDAILAEAFTIKKHRPIHNLRYNGITDVERRKRLNVRRSTKAKANRIIKKETNGNA